MSLDKEGTHHFNQKSFEFVFPTLLCKQKMHHLQVPVDIPFLGSVDELCQRLVSDFSIPAYVEEDLAKALAAFVESENIKFEDDIGWRAIEKVKNGTSDVEEVIKIWEKAFKENTVEYGERLGTNDMELFSTVYHKLVHSPALETILQVEHSHALAVADIIQQRDKQLTALTHKQTDEMLRAVEGVDLINTETEITALASRHLEEHAMAQARWDSQVDGTKEAQRREYRAWLMALFEEKQTTATVLQTPAGSPTSSLASRTLGVGGAHEIVPVLQESFTIHLGSQMKQMHNIRILSADVLDFCQLQLHVPGTQPQRLQTALGLYSNDLCGLVLLTDTHMGTFSGLSKDFIGVCSSSTEFHFASIEEQLERVKAGVKEGVQWRREHCERESPHHCTTLTSSEQQSRRSGTKYLQTGDVYLTRHSNLSDVHVVFHMVVDDSLRSSDINSRHPAILGLRNILKTASSSDITTLTIPVLLMHEMTEEMTVAWCTRRAELVFKCIKGFMIETASWGGSELKNLQFLVPKGISEEVFASLSTMLPSIFRVSNPLVLKASPSPSITKSQVEKKRSEKSSHKIK